MGQVKTNDNMVKLMQAQIKNFPDNVRFFYYDL